MKTAIKIPLICALFLVLVMSTFAAGFGSAYLLTGSGVLPWPKPSQSGEPPQPTPDTGQAVPAPTPTDADEQAFELYWEVWGIVQRDFYGDLPGSTDMTYAAIQGMILSLDDPYTAFVEPEAAAVRAEDASGEYEGIGAYVDQDEDGKLMIVEPFEGSPAAEAGLLPGDRIIAVDGQSIIGLTLYEAISLVRGPAGSDVTLLVERSEEPQPFEVTVTRAHFEIEITEVRMLEDGIGYIRLREFSATAREKLEAGLEELLAEEPRGIVLDLRYNPGGWLDQAVRVSDLFLDERVILTQRWKDGSEEVFSAKDGDIGEDIPIVVLVDRGTASASEIVAGALQDHERAVLIGETTFGKGAVQLVYNLSDGSQLVVTSALWFTPDNQPIHGTGLTPDIEIPWPEEVGPDEDPQLDRAVEYLLTGE